MKHFLLAVVAFLFFQFSYAQQYEETVYLKNGSVFTGIIVEWVPGVHVVLLSDGEKRSFRMDVIEKITRSQVDLSIGMQPGLIGIVDVAYGKGVQSSIPNLLKINALAGYRLSPYVSLALGTGFRGFVGASVTSSYRYVVDHPFIPILGDIRFTLLNNHQSPFFSITGGYASQYAGNKTYAWLVNPAIGAITRVSRGSAIKVSIGYDVALFRNTNSSPFPVNVMHQSIVFQLGFVF